MQRTTELGNVRRVSTGTRRLLARTGLGGCGLLLTGCAAAAGAGAVLAMGLLTGIFLGRVQASFAATAHSYGYTDTGLAQWVFGPSHSSNIEATRFIGRLPGFYFVLINVDGKAVPRSQAQEPVLFTTDVEIDFETFPPTLTGTVTEIEGDQEFPLSEVYPEIGPITMSLSSGAGGHYDIRITIHARGVEGEELAYSLVWHATLSPSGFSLEGAVDIERVLTTADGTEIVIDGSGSLSTDRQDDD